MRAAQAAALALLGVLATAVAQNLNPCQDLTPVSKGKDFTIGLAWWPGGTIKDWGSGSNVISPCKPSSQETLRQNNVFWSTYNARVDRLMLLRLTFPEFLYVFNQSIPSKPSVMSVVAFRAGVQSEPRIVASFNTTETHGYGFVSSLALIAKFDNGNLKYLLWYDLTCNDCGGKRSRLCINGVSCAASVPQCSCNSTTTHPPPPPQALSNASSPPPLPDRPPPPADSPPPVVRRQLMADSTTCNLNSKDFRSCSTAVNLAFEGSDKDYRSFQSAYQVRRLNDYSILGLYGIVKNAFTNAQYTIADSFNYGVSNALNLGLNFQDTFNSTGSQFADNFQNADGTQRTTGST